MLFTHGLVHRCFAYLLRAYEEWSVWRKFQGPRHIYANPIQPKICPILSLGMYWLVFGFDSNPESKHLFPGSNQYERFRKEVQKLLKFQEMLDTIDVMGVKKIKRTSGFYCFLTTCKHMMTCTSISNFWRIFVL